MADQDTQRELNRMYWDSDASVSEIAERLDISRRALYEGIEPRPAGRPCPECGAPLSFRNRTALESGEAECAQCGYETELAAPDDRGNGTGPVEEHGSDGGETRSRALPDAGSGPVLGGAFVSGLALGAVVTYLLQRR